MGTASASAAEGAYNGLLGDNAWARPRAVEPRALSLFPFTLLRMSSAHAWAMTLRRLLRVNFFRRTERLESFSRGHVALTVSDVPGTSSRTRGRLEISFWGDFRQAGTSPGRLARAPGTRWYVGSGRLGVVISRHRSMHRTTQTEGFCFPTTQFITSTSRRNACMTMTKPL